MSEFKTGAVVALRSGGKRMTVRKQNEDGEVVVCWFERGQGARLDEVMQRDVLPASMLVLLDEPTGSDEPAPVAAGPWVLALDRKPKEGVECVVDCDDGERRIARWFSTDTGEYWRCDENEIREEVLRWAEVKP